MTEKHPGMNEDSRGQALSDLVDGRASDAQARALTAAWKDDTDLRRDWHAMQLIGDTLRSADMAQESQAAPDFLAALRGRLAAEPVLLKPRRWQAWLAPMGVAASFVLVALAVPGLQQMLVRPGADQLALQSSGGWPATTGATLTSGQPTFSQSLTEPGVRAVSLMPANGVANGNAVAPFELAVPATSATGAASPVMTSASKPR